MKHIMDWMITEKIAKNDFNAAAIVNGLELYKLADDDAMKARCKLYRDWRNAGEKSKTAFAKAIAGEPVLPEDALPMFDGAMLSVKAVEYKDGKAFVQPKANCPCCYGVGTVSGDWVDYGSTRTKLPDDFCSCVFDQLPEDYEGDIEVVQ